MMSKEKRKSHRLKYYQEHKEEFKKYREEHKEQIKEYNKKYRQKHIKEMKSKLKKHRQKEQMKFEILKNIGCAICGYTKCPAALDFHHVNPSDKKFLISARDMRHKDFIDELNKCVLLCCRCHMELHWREKHDSK